MAHIDIHYGFSVNGVASLHTDILKETELNNFYKLYPEKFNNKTNGITFRRWLLHSNPELTDFITSFIGDGFKKDADGIYTYTSKKIKDDTIKAAMADGESVSEFTLERAVDESSTSTGNAAANTSVSTAAGSATTTASDSSSAEQNSATADTTLINNSNSASDAAEEQKVKKQQNNMQ